MNTEYFKQKLEEEKDVVTRELETVGRQNPENKTDWEAREDEENVDTAEEGDVAESIEVFETNSAILEQLETRLSEINEALSKIEKGTYGICYVCGEHIEEDRLSANPAARTCKVHMNE
jgi:RNA polymerase-binding transcription factor DksA